MKKALFIFSILIVLLATSYVVLKNLRNTNEERTRVTAIVAHFACGSGKSIDATFNRQPNDEVRLVLSDGRTLTVPRAISASGARYATADESFVFWNKGDTAFITENGTSTYARCATGEAALANIAQNLTYYISGKPYTLVDGVSEIPAAPNSASKITTRYFGNMLVKDVNGDGKDDIVFLLTQNTGGSGTFYYVAAVLKTDAGYTGSHAMLIGDRIAPQTTESGKGLTVIVNYADRAPKESFAVQPSIGKSLYLLFDAKLQQFGEIAQNVSL